LSVFIRNGSTITQVPSVPDALVAPVAPAPISLSAGTTSLGTTLIGTWSHPVTVSATCTGSDASTPSVSITGSGEGPYSVSIASGLSDNVTYVVVVTGTGTDGQVSKTMLAVAVRSPSQVIGSIDWQIAGTYDFANCTSSGPYSSPTTITTGGGLPNITLGQDSAGTYSVTLVNGTGIQLSNTGAGRPFISLLPDWSTLGIDALSPDGFAIELEILSPTLAGSAFLTSMLGNAQNPNGSGSGCGARLINTAGNRNGACRMYSVGNSEISPTIITSTSDFANVSMLSGFFPGEMIGSIVSTALPASLSSYTQLYRDGFTRTPMGTTWGLSPGHLSLLFGGGTLSATLTKARFWKRGVS